jgi:hypothetical protein
MRPGQTIGPAWTIARMMCVLYKLAFSQSTYMSVTTHTTVKPVKSGNLQNKDTFAFLRAIHNQKWGHLWNKDIASWSQGCPYITGCSVSGKKRPRQSRLISCRQPTPQEGSVPDSGLFLQERLEGGEDVFFHSLPDKVSTAWTQAVQRLDRLKIDREHFTQHRHW